MQTIPILINNRQIGVTTEESPVISRVWQKWRRVFSVKKVYHNPGKSVIIETKDCNPYRVRAI